MGGSRSDVIQLSFKVRTSASCLECEAVSSRVLASPPHLQATIEIKDDFEGKNQEERSCVGFCSACSTAITELLGF